MSLSFDKQVRPEPEDLAAHLQPATSVQPNPTPEDRTDINILQQSVGNSAVANTASPNTVSLTSNTPRLQSTFGNAAIARGLTSEGQTRTAIVTENSQARSTSPRVEPDSDVSRVGVNTPSVETVPDTATAPTTSAAETSPQASMPGDAALATDESTPTPSGEAATRDAGAVSQTATVDPAEKAKEAEGATEESVAAAENVSGASAIAPAGETTPMPSLMELLGEVEPENTEETAEEVPETLEATAEAPQESFNAETTFESESNFNATPSFEFEAPEAENSALMIQKKPDSDAAPDVNPAPAPEPPPDRNDESSSDVTSPDAGMGGDENVPQTTTAADTRGMADMIAAAASTAQQQIETQKETVRNNLISSSETQSQSVNGQVEAAVASIRAAFAAERAALEVSVNAARVHIATTLAARQAEAVTSGEEAKTALRELYANHRNEITEAVASNIAAAEQMRTHYATMVHNRTREQAADARRRGETKAATYPGDERGRVQANAARGVANRTASEIEQREPEAVAAIEEVVDEIPAQFAEKGAEALSGFDDRLPGLLEQIDNQVREVSEALADKAAEANDQLDTLAEQLLAQLDSLEEASVAQAQAVAPQAEVQTENALRVSLEQLDSATPESIDQITQLKDDAIQTLLAIESPDPASAQEFTNEIIASIFRIAEMAGGGLQQAGGGVESGFENVQSATSESLQAVEQQVLDDIATMRGESDKAISSLADGLDESFGESIDVLIAGFEEIQSQIDTQLGDALESLTNDFGDALKDAEAEVFEAVDAGLSKNDEALAQLGPSMQEAADDAAWDHDHPILSGIRDVALFIAGALAAIVLLVAAIVVVILLFKALAIAAAAGSLLAAIAQVVLVVAGLALLVYGIYEAYQARVRAGEGGGWGTFGMALLDITGLTGMYRAFTQPGLTPFERGWMFGEGLVQLVSTLLLVRGAWRFVRSGGLKTAWQALWRGAGRLVRGIGRGLRGLGRGIGRGIRGIGRWLSGLGGRRGSPPARGGGCFIAGTLVHTPEGRKQIESLAPRDEVTSVDVRTGERQIQPILRSFVRNVPAVVKIRLANETITCSPEHPFWVPGNGWQHASDLAAGTEILTINGENVQVHSMEFREGAFEVFNIEVDGLHCYYVSESGILVHNKAMRRVVPTPEGSLKLRDANWLKRHGVDPHRVKEGLPGSVSEYDIYVDRKGNLFAIRKGAPQSTAEWLGHLDDFKPD